MSHLTAEQLVDLVEGARAEPSAPHLATCASCRRQLADLRAMISAAADVEVPEPSPLFWDHLSARVREAVAAEDIPRGAWWQLPSWAKLVLPAGIAAVVAITIGYMLTVRGIGPIPAQPFTPMAISAVAESADDPSLSLVADLVEQMDWDAASDVGVPTHAGAADEAMGELSSAERREMHRLLKEALARPGA